MIKVFQILTVIQQFRKKACSLYSLITKGVYQRNSMFYSMWNSINRIYLFLHAGLSNNALYNSRREENER